MSTGGLTARPFLAPVAVSLLRFALLLVALPASAQLRYDFSAARAWLDQQRDAAYEGNVVVLVENRAGQRLFEYSAGTFQPDTRKEVASASKWFAGAVLLACHDRGWIDLDDRAEALLPFFRDTGTGTFTVRQAFGMVSGLYQADGTYELNPLLTHGLSVRAIARNVPLVFPPGTQLAYDGAGMQSMGYAAAERRGTDWNSLAREVLLDPLQLGNSAWDYFGALNPAVAGGLSTTPVEYLRFLQMVLNQGRDPRTGVRVLASSSVDLMFQSQSDGLPIFASPWLRWDELVGGTIGRVDYCFGTWTLERDSAGGPVTAVSSPGAFKTFPWVDRRREVAGILFVRVPTSNDTAVPAHLELLRRINAALDLGPWRPDTLALRRGAEGSLRLEWSGPGQVIASTNLTQWQPVTPTPASGALIPPTTAATYYQLAPPP